MPSVVRWCSVRKSLDLLRLFTDYNLIFTKTKLILTIYLATLSSANRRTVTLSHIKVQPTLSIYFVHDPIPDSGWKWTPWEGYTNGQTTAKHWPSLQPFATAATDKICVFISLQWSIFLQTCLVTPWTDQSLILISCYTNFYTLNCPYLKNNFFVCLFVQKLQASFLCGKKQKKHFYLLFSFHSPFCIFHLISLNHFILSEMKTVFRAQDSAYSLFPFPTVSNIILTVLSQHCAVTYVDPAFLEHW